MSIQLTDLPEAVAELGAHEDVDDELGEAVAEAEPHAVEVDLLGNVLVAPAPHALRHADDGERQPRDEEHGRDDEADVVVPGALREVLVHALQKQEEEQQIQQFQESSECIRTAPATTGRTTGYSSSRNARRRTSTHSATRGRTTDIEEEVLVTSLKQQLCSRNARRSTGKPPKTKTNQFKESSKRYSYTTYNNSSKNRYSSPSRARRSTGKTPTTTTTTGLLERSKRYS